MTCWEGEAMKRLAVCIKPCTGMGRVPRRAATATGHIYVDDNDDAVGDKNKNTLVVA